MLDQRLAKDPHALLPGPAYSFMRLLAGYMHHIERHTGHIGDHDRAVGRLTFDLWRTGIGVRFRPAVVLFH